jgi:hypothetical protein
MGRTYEPEAISLEELQLIATHLEVLSKQICAKIEQIKSFNVTAPKIGSIKNATRALKYLDGFEAALVGCLTRLSIDERTNPRQPVKQSIRDFTLNERLT